MNKSSLKQVFYRDKIPLAKQQSDIKKTQRKYQTSVSWPIKQTTTL